MHTILFERSRRDEQTVHVYVVYEHALAGVHACFAYLETPQCFKFGQGHKRTCFFHCHNGSAFSIRKQGPAHEEQNLAIGQPYSK